MARRGGFPGGMPGNMNNLMKQAQKMQRQMEEAAEELGGAGSYSSGRRRSSRSNGFWQERSHKGKIVRRK